MGKKRKKKFAALSVGMPYLPRTFYYQAEMETVKTGPTKRRVRGTYVETKPKKVPAEEANLVSSILELPEDFTPLQEDDWATETRHGICLDIDLPCALVESSPGHYHLYIERDIPWTAYQRLLRALSDAGVIEQGYYQASVEKEGTFLRKHVYDRFFSETGKDYEQLAAATREVLKEVE